MNLGMFSKFSWFSADWFSNATGYSQSSSWFSPFIEGHFTHEIASPWPLHFKHSHWWNKRSWSKSLLHTYTWGTNGAWECKMSVKSTWIPTWHQNGSCFMVTWIIFKNHLLKVGLTHNLGPWHSKCSQPLNYSILSCVRTHMNRNSIWLRVRSHMISHYTLGSVTTLHDFEGVLGRPLDTFFWALTISWSRFLACV